jgi:hypothetical protein
MSIYSFSSAGGKVGRPEPKGNMKMENAIRILAGTMVLTSLALAHFVNRHWLWLAVFVGVNLIQSALTGFCPACNILRRLGVGRGQPGGDCCGPKCGE